MRTHDRTRLHNRQQTNSEQPRPDAYYHDERRDRSAGWRAEYAALHVDPSGHELVTDGGTEFEIPEPGDIVHDMESTHGDGRVLVLSVREKTSAGSEHIEQIGKTVAELNPEHSPHAPLVRCVYLDELRCRGWDSIDVYPRLDGEGDEIIVFNPDTPTDGWFLYEYRSYPLPVDRLQLQEQTGGSGGEDE
jgi:hypothetical protein